MALPAIALAGVGAAAGGSVGAMALGGMGLNYLGQRKAISAQNAANEAAFRRQWALEQEADRLNKSHIYAYPLRPFERSYMIPSAMSASLAGITPEAQAIGDQIWEKQQRLMALDRIEDQQDADINEIQVLNDEVAELARQKSAIESEALAAERSRYDDIVARADETARGIFDGSLLSERLAAMDPMQRLRASLDPLRADYRPRMEAAEDRTLASDQYDQLRQLEIEGVRAGESPLTQELRLRATDASNIEEMQENRRKRAEAIVAAQEQALLQTENELAAKGRFGASSSVMNRLMALGKMESAARAAEARLNAEAQNLQESETWRQARNRALMDNEAQRRQEMVALIGARFRNATQEAELENRRRQLEETQLAREMDDRLLGVSDAMTTAGERQAATMSDIGTKVSNINLPTQLRDRGVSDLTAQEAYMQRLMQGRMAPVGPWAVGTSNMQPPQVPVAQVMPNLYSLAGGALSAGAQHFGQQAAGNQAFNRQKKLMAQSHQNQLGLLRARMDQNAGQQWLGQQGGAISPWGMSFPMLGSGGNAYPAGPPTGPAPLTFGQPGWSGWLR